MCSIIIKLLVIYHVINLIVLYNQISAKFQDSGISDLLPCKPGNLPIHRCKIPLTLTICKERNSTFSTKYPNKYLRYDFSRQVNQTIALLKSLAITLQHSPISRNDVESHGNYDFKKNIALEIFIFTNEKESFYHLVEEIGSWNPKYSEHFQLVLRDATYLNGFEWSSELYAPCTTLRLQLPQLLPTIDSIIYLDTDMILFEHISFLWNKYANFSELQSLSMAKEFLLYLRSELTDVFGLEKVKSHNAGVILMNLTRLRNDENWNLWIINIKKFKDILTYADQDILNLFVHNYPHKFIQLPCQWNFSAYYIRRETQWFCPMTSRKDSIFLLHGTSRLFFKRGRFSIIFKYYFEALSNNNNVTDLFDKILTDLKSIKYCELQHQFVHCDNEYFDSAIIGALQKGLGN